MRCQLCCSSLAHCHLSGSARVGVMLPWCEDGKVPYCPLNVIYEVVWLLLHTFSKHSIPFGSIPLSHSSSLVLGISQGHVGLGVVWCVCVCVLYMFLCVYGCDTFVLCKNGLCKAEYGFTVLICRVVPTSLQIQYPRHRIPKLWIQSCNPRD